ncbi:hypothetical protein Tco_0867560 [Tanacetum coccineum]
MKEEGPREERTFTLVGNECPLTRITATNKVPIREPIPLEVVAQESVVTKVYTRRPKEFLASTVSSLMAYFVTILTPDSTRSCVMQCTLPTEGMRSIISTVSISLEGFLPSILLLAVVIVAVVIVAVI